ncbi:uncharacterized protein [Triticum aestivum]|uniref:uncharacterized protein n=1 Tax=Triticum aestivum TaxID=4565 RepID=UPI001D01F7C6|nr:uncharacterized protein LOC123158465 [Triticum aestivum]
MASSLQTEQKNANFRGEKDCSVSLPCRNQQPSATPRRPRPSRPSPPPHAARPCPFSAAAPRRPPLAHALHAPPPRPFSASLLLYRRCSSSVGQLPRFPPLPTRAPSGPPLCLSTCSIWIHSFLGPSTEESLLLWWALTVVSRELARKQGNPLFSILGRSCESIRTSVCIQEQVRSGTFVGRLQPRRKRRRTPWARAWMSDEHLSSRPMLHTAATPEPLSRLTSPPSSPPTSPQDNLPSPPPTLPEDHQPSPRPTLVQY